MRRRRAFTLVELLTVMGIIALLVALLMPALSKARDAAKRAKTAGLLAAIEKGLEAFHTDFGYYPDSLQRMDPIDWQTAGIKNYEKLNGAHWLARALAGHDAGGVDAQGVVLDDGQNFASSGGGNSKPPNPTVAQLRTVDRKPVYIDGDVFALDDDVKKFPGPIGQGNFKYSVKKRQVMYDESFGSPVLYYRANSKATEQFCRTGGGWGAPGKHGDRAGIYCHQDNSWVAGDDDTDDWGWDFGGTGQPHRIMKFGTVLQSDIDLPDNRQTFTYFLHDPAAPKTTGYIVPQNPDRFILITAGKDNLFGTDDDVTNLRPPK